MSMVVVEATENQDPLALLPPFSNSDMEDRILGLESYLETPTNNPILWEALLSSRRLHPVINTHEVRKAELEKRDGEREGLGCAIR